MFVKIVHCMLLEHRALALALSISSPSRSQRTSMRDNSPPRCCCPTPSSRSNPHPEPRTPTSANRSLAASRRDALEPKSANSSFDTVIHAGVVDGYILSRDQFDAFLSEDTAH